MKRTSVVDHLEINSLSDSSILEIGDAHRANPTSKAIALQKEGPTFQGNLIYSDYPIFKRTPNYPSTQPRTIKRTIHHDPMIHLHQANMIAVTLSSIVQVGQLKHLHADARVKHFRIIYRRVNNHM